MISIQRKTQGYYRSVGEYTNPALGATEKSPYVSTTLRYRAQLINATSTLINARDDYRRVILRKRSR